MAKFVTDASGATWWPNLEPMQVAFFLLAGEITQVKEAIPWVRCGSANVLVKAPGGNRGRKRVLEGFSKNLLVESQNVLNWFQKKDHL